MEPIPDEAQLPWIQPEWLAEAGSWVHDQLAQYGLTASGMIEQPHVRWWSTVLRVPTTDGDLYFKAVAPVHRYEVPLTALLAELQPGRVPEVLAVDVERGWLVVRDGGSRLRELVRTATDLHHWVRLLPEYAQLQIDVAPHAGSMLALGAPDERLLALPEQLRGLLASQPPGLTPEEHERLVAAVPDFEATCRELAAYGIAETIQHDDLHDGQVLVRDGRYRVFDWGDSCVSHPFHSLTVTLMSIAWKLDLEPGGRELRRLRDAYLEPFGDLQEAADLAYWTGMVGRALAWHRMVAARPPAFVDEEDLDAPADRLRLFLAGGPIGTFR